uniref:Uncharacterized protein n=1 Tax=Ananas comosus var. bracteatus TaxID=296719 RepID=A0A6V7QA23_ANACO|nr:unnamed protein product [Ananas comosus var. bracteatus]
MNAANQDDWLSICRTSTVEGWSEEVLLEALRETVLFNASSRCYGSGADMMYDGKLMLTAVFMGKEGSNVVAIPPKQKIRIKLRLWDPFLCLPRSEFIVCSSHLMCTRMHAFTLRFGPSTPDRHLVSHCPNNRLTHAARSPQVKL